MRNKARSIGRVVRVVRGDELLVREPKGSAERVLSREDVRSVVRAVHVVPETAGGWEVRKSGRRRVVKHFETKEAAVSFAETLTGEGCDLYIHDNPPAPLRRPLRADS